MLSEALWLAIELAQSPQPVPPMVVEPQTSFDFVKEVVAPILGTGLIGSLFLMVLFRIKIMPTYVYDQAKASWDAERDRLTTENGDLKDALKESHKIYTEQVIPTLTRVLDAERELVDLRRQEAMDRRRRDGP